MVPTPGRPLDQEGGANINTPGGITSTRHPSHTADVPPRRFRGAQAKSAESRRAALAAPTTNGCSAADRTPTTVGAGGHGTVPWVPRNGCWPGPAGRYVSTVTRVPRGCDAPWGIDIGTAFLVKRSQGGGDHRYHSVERRIRISWGRSRAREWDHSTCCFASMTANKSWCSVPMRARRPVSPCTPIMASNPCSARRVRSGSPR